MPEKGWRLAILLFGLAAPPSGMMQAQGLEERPFEVTDGLFDPDIFFYLFHSSSIPPAGANRGRFRDAEVAGATANSRHRNGDRVPGLRNGWPIQSRRSTDSLPRQALCPVAEFGKGRGRAGHPRAVCGQPGWIELDGRQAAAG